MSDSDIQVDQGTANIFVDTSQVATGSGTVQRQRVAIYDGTQAGNALSIGSDGAASVHVINTVASVSVLNPSAASVSVLNPTTTVTANQGGAPWSVSQSGSPWSASVQGQVGVVQVTSPWVTSGTSTVSGSVSVVQAGSWSINQGTNPWITTTSGSVSVLNPTTTVTANQGGAPWTVNASQSGNWGASVTQGTSPWVTSGSVNAIASGSVSVNNFPPTTAVTQSTNPWIVSDAQTPEVTAAWASVSPVNTSASINVFNYPTATVFLNQGASVTSGTVAFEGSDTGGINWYAVDMVSTAGPAYQGTTYNFIQNTNVAFQANVAGFTFFRARLSASISGQGTVNVGLVGTASDADFDGAVGTVSAPINVGQTTSSSVSAVQLSSRSVTMTNGILVQALSTNTASVFIGGLGTTTTTGYELQAGQAAPFTAANINQLYVVGSNNGDGICWNVT